LLPQQAIGAFTVVTFTKDGRRDWISVEAIRNNPDTDEEDEYSYDMHTFRSAMENVLVSNSYSLKNML